MMARDMLTHAFRVPPPPKGLSYPDALFRRSPDGLEGNAPMTLCVGAFCQNGDVLVMASDLMVSIGNAMTHSPALMKGYAFNFSWFGTFAGSVTPFEAVMNRFLKRIEHEPNSFTVITDAFEEAYQAERNLQLSRQVTGRYGLTLNDFLKNGKRKLSDRLYSKLTSEIKRFDLGADLMVGGMDEKKIHHLLAVYNPGHVEHFTGHGYGAIGIGAEHALNVFRLRAYNWGQFSAIQGMRAVLEAKFFGEGPYVGQETILTALDFKQGQVLKLYLQTHADVRRFIRRGQLDEAEKSLTAEIKDGWQPLSTL
jgi:hypothetical protein